MCEIIFLILVHSKKAIVDNVSNEFGNDIVSKLLQRSKAIVFNVTIEFGITTEVKPVQPKGSHPNSVTELGMVIDVKPVQPNKAKSPIDVTELGIVVVLQPKINLLLEVSIIALQLFRESYFVLSLATTIDANSLHWLKEVPLTEVTEFGMVTEVKSGQYAKA